MRCTLVLLLIALVGTTVRADPIRYDQISAQAVSYFHLDIERLLTCRLAQTPITGGETLRSQLEQPEFKSSAWGSATSITGFTLTQHGDIVVLLRASAEKFRNEIEKPKATETTVIQYGQQEVHYSSSCLLPSVFGANNAK